MKLALRFLPFTLLVMGAGSALFLWSLRQPPPVLDDPEPKTLVTTVEVQRCQDGFPLRIDGQVIPFREINLAAQVRGQIIEKTPVARAGNYVRKGQKLFQINPKDYELQLKRLQESVKQANSSIEESDVEKSNVMELINLARDQLALRNSDVARFEDLKNRGAASDSQLENARQLELQSQNALQTLQNQITLIDARRNRLAQEKESALTSLDLAELDLKRTTITAPIDGIVIQDLAEQDDYVQVGAPLVQLEDTSKVEVRFSLRMEKLRWLWSATHSAPLMPDPSSSTYALPPVEMKVNLEIDGHHFSWPARLDRYDGAGINAATRTAPLIATVDDPTAVSQQSTDEDALPLAAPPTLLRGTFVTVEIKVGSSFDLVTIPSIALRPGGRVWLRSEDNKLHQESVQVAHATKDTIVLLAEPGRLEAGDYVITSPLPVVVDGMDVEDIGESSEPARSGETVATQETRPANSL